MEGTFKHMKQVGGRGSFALVRLSLEVSDRDVILFEQCVTPAANPDPKPYYAAAATFGIRVALERRYDCRYRVNVLEIMTVAVDASEAAVAYAACQAVLNALDCSDELMSLDSPNGTLRVRF